MRKGRQDPASVLRATLYLLAAGILWMTEGFLFSQFLKFSLWQVILMAIVYLALFGIAAYYLVRSISSYPRSEGGLPAWRLISLAPMLVVIVGSFASLPVLLIILALGKLLHG